MRTPGLLRALGLTGVAEQVLSFAQAAAALPPKLTDLPLPTSDGIPDGFTGPVVSTIRMEWYTRCATAYDPAGAFVAAAQAHFPGAMPVKFGTTEPVRRSFARAGLDGLREAIATATSTSSVTTAGTTDHFSMFFPALPAVNSLATLTGSLVADNLDDTRLDALRAFFVAVAQSLDCFNATAYLVPGFELDKNTLYLTPLANSASWSSARTLQGRRQWMGLSPAPALWTWFGAPYLACLDKLPPERVHRAPGGGLYDATYREQDGVGLPITNFLPHGMIAPIVQPLMTGARPLLNRATTNPPELCDLT